MAENLITFKLPEGPLSIEDSTVEVNCTFEATGIEPTKDSEIVLAYSMSPKCNWKIKVGSDSRKERRLSGTFVVKVELESDSGQEESFSLTITATLGSKLARSVDVKKTPTPAAPQNPPQS